jgi:hypothetical protein
MAREFVESTNTRAELQTPPSWFLRAFASKNHRAGIIIRGQWWEVAFTLPLLKEEIPLWKGSRAFEELRNKKGSFYFMDTYVFVDTPEGVELVNPAQPYLEGKNIAELKNAGDVTIVKDYISEGPK